MYERVGDDALRVYTAVDAVKEMLQTDLLGAKY